MNFFFTHKMYAKNRGKCCVLSKWPREFLQKFPKFFSVFPKIVYDFSCITKKILNYSSKVSLNYIKMFSKILIFSGSSFRYVAENSLQIFLKFLPNFLKIFSNISQPFPHQASLKFSVFSFNVNTFLQSDLLRKVEWHMTSTPTPTPQRTKLLE